MKLSELKQKVYQSWKSLSSFKGQLLNPDDFKSEVRHFGDLRRKQTWVRALARFEAVNAYQSCLDASSLLLYSFNFTPDRWDYDYRHQIFEEFLMYGNALDLIKLGLEQLYQHPYTEDDRREAHGFFELVAEQAGRRLGSLTVEPAGQQLAASSAA
jgi:hypothetical protein